MKQPDMTGLFTICTIEGDKLAEHLTIEALDDWWKAHQTEWFGERIEGQTVIVKRW